ncbi:immunoglobulin kappa light chain-like [Pelobates fuscus]|uniref:immunoglobulin kappa light chain-like n=1 Tax=Pelobates fuscus TaxID=191477 RepID=UPI002FE44154
MIRPAMNSLSDFIDFTSVWVTEGFARDDVPTNGYECFTINQSPDSITKFVPVQSTLYTATLKCTPSSSPGGNYIHWYIQKPNKELKRILYTLDENAVYDSGYNNEKFVTGKKNSEYSLTVKKLNIEDSGTYYCAVLQYFQKTQCIKLKIVLEIQFLLRKSPLCKDASVKRFGTGTKLSVISSQSVSEPKATILSSSEKEVQKTGKLIYMCVIQNFYPDVIKVVWNKEGNTADLAAEQGDIVLDDQLKTYSLTSWITVDKADYGKRFSCKYKHEGVTSASQWGSTSIGEGKAKKSIDVDDQSESCPNRNNSYFENVLLKPTTYQAAYITYTLLLLKSVLYCPILVLTYKFAA